MSADEEKLVRNMLCSEDKLSFKKSKTAIKMMTVQKENPIAVRRPRRKTAMGKKYVESPLDIKPSKSKITQGKETATKSKKGRSVASKKNEPQTANFSSKEVSQNSPPLSYWKGLAEQRLYENELLCNQLEVLEAENYQLKLLLKEAEDSGRVVRASTGGSKGRGRGRPKKNDSCASQAVHPPTSRDCLPPATKKLKRAASPGYLRGPVATLKKAKKPVNWMPYWEIDTSATEKGLQSPDDALCGQQHQHYKLVCKCDSLDQLRKSITSIKKKARSNFVVEELKPSTLKPQLQRYGVFGPSKV